VNTRRATIRKYGSQLEAFAALASFVFYAITNCYRPVCLIFWAIVGVNIFSLQDYARSDKSTVKVATPASSQNLGFQLIPEAVAGSLGDSIKVNGVFWGMRDPNFECWKIAGKPTILLYGRSEGKMFSIDAPGLSQSRLQKLK
jgi:hypothetical protein